MPRTATRGRSSSLTGANAAATRHLLSGSVELFASASDDAWGAWIAALASSGAGGPGQRGGGGGPLTGFREALRASPGGRQKFVVYQIRNSLTYAARKDSAALGPIAQAPTEAERTATLADLAADGGIGIPSGGWSREANWGDLAPLHRYPEELRRTTYTTNLIEGVHRPRCKATCWIRCANPPSDHGGAGCRAGARSWSSGPSTWTTT